MTSRISLRIFFVCLIACATMALGVIWFEHKITSPLYFQTAATLFITGLTSFLIWFSLTLVSIRKFLQEETKSPKIS